MNNGCHSRNHQPRSNVSSNLRKDSLPGDEFFDYREKETKPARILGESMMIIPYSWEIARLEREYKTIASKMLSFRDEKVFRVGLKNRDRPTLIFIAIDLNNIGIRVREVCFSISSLTSNSESRQKMTHNNVDGYSLQLFTFELPAMILGTCTFNFSIWLEGSVPRSYSYLVSDRLVKEQLWKACSSSKHFADIEVVCKDKKFSVHKAILAARSSVFAAKFAKTVPLGNGPLQILINDVDPSAVEQFLYFLYTGEPKKPILYNEELLKLALRFKLNTLVELCQIANHKIDVMQMASFVSNLELDQSEVPSIVSISPNKDSCVTHSNLESTYRVIWIFKGRKSAEKPLAIEYQNENLFSLHLKEGIVHFICVNQRKLVKRVLYSTNDDNWYEMKPKNAKQKWEKSEMLFFVVNLGAGVNFEILSEQTIVFDIKMLSTIPNYSYEMMDVAWAIQLWDAAVHGLYTDVDIFVGGNKLMEAHKFILSARSSVLLADLIAVKEKDKCAVRFSSEMDAHVVEHFIFFLYTGSSTISFKNKQLLELAEKYQVETLIQVCKLCTVSSPDVDEVTNFLLGNF